MERPQAQRVMDGHVASFSCRVTGIPEPTISWAKDGMLLTEKSRFIILSVPQGSILRIDPVRSQNDEGTYECTVKDLATDLIIYADAKLEILSDDRKYCVV